MSEALNNPQPMHLVAAPPRMGRVLHPSIKAAIRRLPSDNATSSRDFGRGYAHAIQDVLDLLKRIEWEDRHDNTQ